MADTREVRTFASEVKFVVGPDVAERVRAWAREHLAADPHGTGDFNDQYLTSSVYFDTARHDVFHRRGSFGRSKYRVRRYGHDDVVFLERKLREPTVLAKRRTVAPLTALERLAKPRGEAEWGGRWFEQRIAARRLAPVCQVSYHRTARMAVTGSDIVRLTVDDSLAARATSELSFGVEDLHPVLAGRAIVELKYRHTIPTIFKRMVEQFALTAQQASKYRLSMVGVGAFPEAALFHERPRDAASGAASYV